MKRSKYMKDKLVRDAGKYVVKKTDIQYSINRSYLKKNL